MDDTDPPATPTKKPKLEQTSTSTDVAMEDAQAELHTSADTQSAVPANHPQGGMLEAAQPIDQLNKEAACGITEFVSPDLLGFTGILKKRYTDFLVNEILPSGQVVHLDDLKAPKPMKRQEIPYGGAISAPANPTSNTAQAPLKQDTSTNQQEQKTETFPDKVNGGTTGGPLSPQVNLDAECEQNTTSKASTDSVITPQKFTAPPGMAAQDATPPQIPTPDLHKDEPKKLAPHLRIPPPSPSVPLSMRDLDGTESATNPEQKKRKKETVLIRQTAEGWVEVDEAKEKELKEEDAAGDGAAGIEPGLDATETPIQQEPEIEEKRAMGPPPIPSTQAQWQAFAGPPTGFQLNREDRNTMVNYFGANTVDAITALYDRVVKSPHRKSKDYGEVKSGKISRETRSKLHRDIRRIFSSRLETVTDNDGAMIITAMTEKPAFHARTPMNNGRGNDRGNDRGSDRGSDRGKRSNQWSKPSWKELGGDHLHFSLFKENKDTMESISWLAKELRMKPGAFQFAGTKDRRGVTVQRVSVYRVLVDRLIGAGRTLRMARIGNFEYQPHQLQLGELSGNEFVITLRDSDFHYPVPVDSRTMFERAQSIVGTAIKNLVERGFINYYGLQRFGSFSTGTDDVGVKMLQGDLQGAVDAILHYSPTALAAAQDPMSDNDKISQDDKARAYAIHDFKTTGKAQSALHTLPRKFSAESNIIRHLSGQNHSNDYHGALQSIQRNLRLMYVHAYQSLVWNMAASERWKRFGAGVVEGDLVLIDEHFNKKETNIHIEDVDTDGEAVVLPAEDDRAADPEDKFTRARALTKEEAESGKYTIFDIVLPTPGYDILYPANELLNVYEDLMASERGGGLDPHDMRRNWKDVSLSGSYRKVLARPLNDMTFEIKMYKDDDEQFVETDLDRINKAKQEQFNGQHSRSAPLPQEGKEMGDTTNDPKEFDGHLVPTSPNVDTKSELSDTEQGGVSLSGGPYRDYKIAVILKMQLGTSQYATMALRELMKLGGVKTYKPDFGGGR